MKTFRSVAFLLAFGFLFNITASQATSRLDQSSSQHATSVFTTDERRNLGVDEEKSPQKSVPVASGLLSGIIGTILSGPIVGTISGFGASFAADKTEGFWGDTARAVGEISLVVHEKAKEIDLKYDVRGRLKLVTKLCFDKLLAKMKKHDVGQKAKVFFQYSIDSFFGFCREHHLVERSLDTAKKVLAWSSDQIEEAMKKQMG